MGSLLSSNSTPPSTIQINFTNPPKPTDNTEIQLINDVEILLKQANEAITIMENYTGCEELIRLAMSNPGDDEKQKEAFKGMFPNVQHIKTFYQLGKDLDEVCGKMVTIFVQTNNILDHQNLLKQFGSILNFALKFDRCKMLHPAVQNDFSFYRRALGKNARMPGIPVDDVEANNISMFIAQSTPIISELVVTMDNLQRKIQVADFLADFAHICCANVMFDKTKNIENSKYAFSSMVVSLVIYDHIYPEGSFSNSKIQLKTCVIQLRNNLNGEDRNILFDALQYSTKTFNKAPDSIKKIISAR